MKPLTKQILFISGTMIIGGTILTGIGKALGGHPGVAITGTGIHSPYEYRQPHTLSKTEIDPYSTLNLNVSASADVKIEPSEDEHFYLEYTLDGRDDAPRYEIKDDTLTFTQKNSGAIHFIGFDSNYASEIDSDIILYIPKEQVLDKTQISLSDGDLSIDRLSSDTVSIDLEYGNLTIKNADFKQADLTIDSGDLTADSLSADNLTGDFEYTNAGLYDFTCKNAVFSLDSGDLTIDAAELGNLKAAGEYSSVKLTLPKPFDAYTVDAVTEYGNITLSEAIKGRGTSSFNDEDDMVSYHADGSADKTISLSIEDGDISLDGILEKQ